VRRDKQKQQQTNKERINPVKALNPTLERLEERIAPGLICGGGGGKGEGGGSSASNSHSSKSKSTKGTDSGTCHCKKHSH
jgi:hypothetical protein